MADPVKQINDMLGGMMYNHHEDEVEDELDAMEKEVVGVPSLPDAPVAVADDMPQVPSEEMPTGKVKEKAREPIAA